MVTTLPSWLASSSNIAWYPRDPFRSSVWEVLLFGVPFSALIEPLEGLGTIFEELEFFDQRKAFIN